MPAPQDNWLDAQLKEAKNDYGNWPQWMKDCSRSEEFIRNKEASVKKQNYPRAKKLISA